MAVTLFALERIQGAPNVPGEFTADDASFTKNYKVLVSSDQDDAYVIKNHASCPAIGDSYAQGSSTDTSSRVTNIRITPLGGRYDGPTGNAGEWAWHVEVTYSRKGETVENPLNRPAKVYYDMEQYDAPLDRDLDDVAVLNSAEQPFDPPALKEDNRIIVRIEKNLATFDAAVAELFSNAVNSATFIGFAADTLRVTKISASPQEDAVYGDYYAVTAEMQFRAIEYTGHKPHQANILDMGRYELYAPGGDTSSRWSPILDTEGQHVTDSVPLDGFGRVKAASAAAVYLEFRRYPSYDFNALGIYP
jgi:hypothetical protein